MGRPVDAPRLRVPIKRPVAIALRDMISCLLKMRAVVMNVHQVMRRTQLCGSNEADKKKAERQAVDDRISPDGLST